MAGCKVAVKVKAILNASAGAPGRFRLVMLNMQLALVLTLDISRPFLFRHSYDANPQRRLRSCYSQRVLAKSVNSGQTTLAKGSTAVVCPRSPVFANRHSESALRLQADLRRVRGRGRSARGPRSERADATQPRCAHKAAPCQNTLSSTASRDRGSAHGPACARLDHVELMLSDSCTGCWSC